jgi:hypothetical protein
MGRRISYDEHLYFESAIAESRHKMSPAVRHLAQGGSRVKKRMLVSAAAGMIILASTLAGAQNMSGKTVTISGRVSDDAKKVVSENNEKWAVSNPETLTTRAGQQVTVKCRLDLEKNKIQVLSVKPAANETRYAVNYGDAAFRR